MKKGFTLIELLVVVLIIGILSAVALPQYTKAVEKSRATEAMTLLGELLKAEQMYKLANGSYTMDITKLDIDFPDIQESSVYMFHSNYYRFFITQASSNSFAISIARVDKNKNNATGDLGYFLRLNINADGSISRTCVRSATICKAITNGLVCPTTGTTENWCYDPDGN